jgi:hypothetical protein
MPSCPLQSSVPLTRAITHRKLSHFPSVQITDSVLMVSINIASHTSSNLIDPNDHTVLTPENIKEREFGSKMVLVVEQMQLLTTWSVKGCLLILYDRITSALPPNYLPLWTARVLPSAMQHEGWRENTAVKIVAAYVVLGFVVMEILYLGVWCRPFGQYWAVPPENSTCRTELLFSQSTSTLCPT